MHRFLPLAALGLVACATRTHQPTRSIPDEQTVDVAVTAEEIVANQAIAIAAKGVACSSDECRVLLHEGLHTIDPETLALGDVASLPPGDWQAVRHTPSGWELLGEVDGVLVALPLEGSARRLEPPSTVDQDDVFALRGMLSEEIRRSLSNQGRMPFLPMVPPPGGGVVLYQVARGQDDAAWIRIGGPSTGGTPAPGSTEPPWSEVPLALHPTGSELYATPWPHPGLLVLDPHQLTERWSLPTEGPTQGLFIDGTGRLLVAEEAPPGEVDPLQAAPTLIHSDELGPADDLMLHHSPRIDAAYTLVIDLRPGAVAARLKGSFTGLARAPGGGWLLATTNGVARLTPRAAVD